MNNYIFIDWGSKKTKVAVKINNKFIIYNEDGDYLIDSLYHKELNLKIFRKSEYINIRKDFYDIKSLKILLFNVLSDDKNKVPEKDKEEVKKLVTDFFNKIKEKLDRKFTKIIDDFITVTAIPAEYYNEHQETVKKILEDAGFNSIYIYEESRAAIFGAYEYYKDRNDGKIKRYFSNAKTSNKLFAVYDIGHFTTDFAICKIEEDGKIIIQEDSIKSTHWAGKDISKDIYNRVIRDPETKLPREKIKLYYSYYLNNKLNEYDGDFEKLKKEALPQSIYHSGINKPYNFLDALSYKLEENIIYLKYNKDDFFKKIKDVILIILTGGSSNLQGFKQIIQAKIKDKIEVVIPESQDSSYLLILYGLKKLSETDKISIIGKSNYNISVTITDDADIKFGPIKLYSIGETIKETKKIIRKKTDEWYFWAPEKNIYCEIKFKNSDGKSKKKTMAVKTKFSGFWGNTITNSFKIITYYNINKDKLEIVFKNNTNGKKSKPININKPFSYMED